MADDRTYETMKEWQVSRLRTYSPVIMHNLDVEEVVTKLLLRNIFTKVRGWPLSSSLCLNPPIMWHKFDPSNYMLNSLIFLNDWWFLILAWLLSVGYLSPKALLLRPEHQRCYCQTSIPLKSGHHPVLGVCDKHYLAYPVGWFVFLVTYCALVLRCAVGTNHFSVLLKNSLYMYRTPRKSR